MGLRCWRHPIAGPSLLLLLLLLAASSLLSSSVLSFSAHSSTFRSTAALQMRFSGLNRRILPLHMASDEDDEQTTTKQPQEQLSRQEAIQRMLQQDGIVTDDNDVESQKRRNLAINVVAGGLLAASAVASYQLFTTNVYTPQGFQRIPTQFIAALGDPKASQGEISSSSPWGLWKLDPGPRGVWLRDFDKELGDSVAPVGWKFDGNDFWVEEHGIIMESPEFPLSPGRYLVTGGRMVTTGLTIDKNGHWELDEGTLYDVTHLPCRSARYKNGSPKNANLRDFPVAPGAEMPAIEGCSKQDYAVLFLVGKAK